MPNDLLVDLWAVIAGKEEIPKRPSQHRDGHPEPNAARLVPVLESDPESDEEDDTEAPR